MMSSSSLHYIPMIHGESAKMVSQNPGLLVLLGLQVQQRERTVFRVKLLAILHLEMSLQYLCFYYFFEQQYQLMLHIARSQFRAQPSRDVRLQPPSSQANFNNTTFCPQCRNPFLSEHHQCKLPCQYCHELHRRKDLIENMCPVIYPFAKREQQKHSFQCKNCFGLGQFTQEVQISKYESTRKYEERLKEWRAKMALQKCQLQMPQRKVLHKNINIKQMRCPDCQGKGKIMRLILCCTQGCQKCDGSRYLINPMWQHYRKQPALNQNLFNCPICLMDVALNQEIYILDCRHSFHSNCIFKWMKTKRSCPVCRQTDDYMKGVEFPITLIDVDEVSSQYSNELEIARFQPHTQEPMHFRMRIHSEDDEYVVVLNDRE